MRGASAIAGLVALTVASCNRAQPVALNAPLSETASKSALAAPDDPPATGSVAQDPSSQVACTQQVAAEIVGRQLIKASARESSFKSKCDAISS
jgi:hypothetical protein